MDLPDRPAPPRSLFERVRTWVQWVGPGRLAASALAVLIVLGGGYWLVKPPEATTESKLPYAGSATTVSATSATTAVGAVVTTTTIANAFLVVHVAGAVSAPGVYQVVAGSRVIDAVQAAGGLAVDANPDAVNLAALVADGERVYIPAVGELLTPVAAAGNGSGSPTEVGPININSADSARLEDLPGVGPATAAAIIAYRDQHGAFASVEQLADVRGIGPAKLDAIRQLVTV
ncbi:MAG: helix-hairpin-helix domain-containing protein [Actinomycetia bacterium]|nr:helix-hairpin-helix domain-containing protein [Actinomycetes bacterium]